MAREDVWQQTVDISNRVLQCTSGLNLPKGNHWPTVVTVFLSQANERLDSIRLLIGTGYWDSSVIVTRTLFELAVNIAYIAKNPAKRLPPYLKHGGIPLTSEEAERLQRQLAQTQPPVVKDLVPGKAWKTLKDMCCDLGSQWLKEYETFYRYVSVPTHAGSFTLGENYKRLLDQQPVSDRDKVTVLITASAFHLRVAGIAAKVFPEQINLKTIDEMSVECQELGQSLAEEQV